MLLPQSLFHAGSNGISEELPQGKVPSYRRRAQMNRSMTCLTLTACSQLCTLVSHMSIGCLSASRNQKQKHTCISPKSVIRGEQAMPSASDLLVLVSCLALCSAKCFLRSTATLSPQNIFHLTLFHEHGSWSSAVLFLFCGPQTTNLYHTETLSSFTIFDSGVICTSQQ
jgi:hypothetical protein